MKSWIYFGVKHNPDFKDADLLQRDDIYLRNLKVKFMQKINSRETFVCVSKGSLPGVNLTIVGGVGLTTVDPTKDIYNGWWKCGYILNFSPMTLLTLKHDVHSIQFKRVKESEWNRKGKVWLPGTRGALVLVGAGCIASCLTEFSLCIRTKEIQTGHVTDKKTFSYRPLSIWNEKRQRRIR